MGTRPDRLVELLARADAERAAGRGADAARLYEEAAVAAREADDLALRARAVLGLAGVHVFGTEPGRLPPLLYDVLVRTTEDGLRSRLAAALARCWVYADEAARGVPFAEEAVERARATGDPGELANALDAALATRWGPDDLDARRALAGELAEVAAHVTDPEARLQAHLWGLQVACESLDLPAMHRHIRALERLGDESPRALHFAATRRAMLDLVRDRTDTVARLTAVAAEAEERTTVADGWMVRAVLQGYADLQDDRFDAVAEMSSAAETFALAEGSTVVTAEAAFLWSACGRTDRAAVLARSFGGGVLARLPRDVNWLLTLQLVLEVALAIDDAELVAEASDLLLPYAGRAVVNAGAVTFHGTTDDPLSRALTARGRDAEAAELRARALATYERIGAHWWRRRLLGGAPAAAQPRAARRVHLHPAPGGLWHVGPAASPVPALRGLEYLRVLLRHPGNAVGALDLVGGDGVVVAETGLGEVADRRALQAYRSRLRELDDELDEAQEWADDARVAAARAERDALLEEIGRATGLGGRSRVTGSSHERARVAVRKAIATALGRIEEVDPDLGSHLRHAVRTGLSCVYEPEPGTAPGWVLD